MVAIVGGPLKRRQAQKILARLDPTGGPACRRKIEGWVRLRSGRSELRQMVSCLDVVEPWLFANQHVDVLDRRIDCLVNHAGDLPRQRSLLLLGSTFPNVALNDGHRLSFSHTGSTFSISNRKRHRSCGKGAGTAA